MNSNCRLTVVMQFRHYGSLCPIQRVVLSHTFPLIPETFTALILPASRRFPPPSRELYRVNT